MLPLTVRLASTLALIRESGGKVEAIMCSSEDLTEMVRKGYVSRGKAADSYKFEKHDVLRSDRDGTYVVVLKKGGARGFVEV
jgi:hypothetical protein